MNHERTIKIKTECEKCVFLETNLVSEADFCFQHDCLLDRIRTYYKKGLLEYDNDYPVVQTVCSTFRKTRMFPESMPLEIKQAKKDVQIQVSFIIVDYYEPDVFSKIKQTIQYCNNQTIQPISIVVVSKNEGVNYTELYDMIKTKSKSPISLVRMYQECNLAECIDSAVKRCYGKFYTLLAPGTYFPTNFIEKLNRKINEDLDPFIIVDQKLRSIDEKKYDGLTVQIKAHNMVDGNVDRWVVEKIKDLAKEQKLERMIVDYAELK